MTFAERVAFYGACAVVESACLMLCVVLAGEGRTVWAIVAGVVGVMTAHAEARVTNWAGAW